MNPTSDSATPLRLLAQFILIFLRMSGIVLASTSLSTADGSNPSLDGDRPPYRAMNDGAIVSRRDSVDLVRDSHVQEAIDRRPELNYSDVRIDGESSDVSLGNIPADAVEAVEVMKAVTPDIDADSQGNFVSLRSKPIYGQSGTAVKGSFGLSYSSLFDTADANASFSMSGPVNAEKSMGGRVSARWNQSTAGSFDLFQDWGWSGANGAAVRTLHDSRREAWRENREEKELGLSLDGKIGKRLSLYLRSNYTDKHSNFVKRRRQFRFDSGKLIAATPSSATVSGATAHSYIEEQSKSSRLIEIGTGSHFETDYVECDLRLVYQKERSRNPNQLAVDFAKKDVDLRYELAEEDRRFPEIFSIGTQTLNTDSGYAFHELRLENRSSNQSDRIASLDLRFNEIFPQPRNYLKLGLKSRQREEEQSDNVRLFGDFGRNRAEFSLDQALSPVRIERFLFDRYVLSGTPDGDLTRDFVSKNLSEFHFDRRRSREESDPNTYSAEESVNAAYAMANLEADRWRCIVGYRYEDATVAFTGSKALVGEDGAYQGSLPATGKKPYGNAFPNAHFRYNWGKRITIIGSYTETIERPWYADIVPTRSINRQQRLIREGNPNLWPTLFSNRDLSFDIETTASGLLSIELFDRSIDNTIFLRRERIEVGEFAGFDRERKENGNTARQYGLRFTIRQPLDSFEFLPDGLSINATYTLQDSEIEYPDRPGETLPLPWTSESFIDASLEYENERVYLQLKYMHNEPMLARVGENFLEDKFQLEQERISLDASWKYAPNARLSLELSNLSSSPDFDTIEGNRDYPLDIREIPWSLQLGVKWTL